MLKMFHDIMLRKKIVDYKGLAMLCCVYGECEFIWNRMCHEVRKIHVWGSKIGNNNFNVPKNYFF